LLNAELVSAGPHQYPRQTKAAESGAATFIIACSWPPLVELT
jgi:hypothetical protein